MCNAWSGVVLPDRKVLWEFGVDSHDKIIDKYKLKDDKLGKFARVEIRPKNKIKSGRFDYLNPRGWEFVVDEKETPEWLKTSHEQACWAQQAKWKKKLDTILVYHSIIHPFVDVKPPKITDKHIALLQKWDSVRDSVGDSVGDSVRDSVRDSVGDSVGGSVWDSVGDSVWDSVRGSVWDSVWDSVRDSEWDSVWDSVRGSVYAYIGSFFKLDKWQRIKHKKGAYPFQPAVDLWNMGLVASFDGKKWRLHGGKDAKVLFEISQKDLKKWKLKKQK